MRRRKGSLRRELADLTFRLFAAGGLVLGLLSGLNSPAPEPAACKPGASCVGPGLWAGMEPILVPALIGLVAGGALGFALARAIRGRPSG